MHKKAKIRLRRSKAARARMKKQGANRLTIHRTPKHIYAQVTNAEGSKTFASASTIEADVKAALSGFTGNVEAAKVVGKVIAEKAVKAGIKQVAYDRSGFAYHGRVAALADAARENGLEF